MKTKTIKCVLVDDESISLDILKEYTQKISYLELIQTFESSLEAYSFILKNPIDLLITDLQMPKINGIELCLHVNDFTPTQVIFMSGYSEQIIESLQLAVTDYLHKPISFDRFEQAIQKALIFANMERKAIMNINDDFLSMDKKNIKLLTDTELNVLKLIASGNSTQKIANSIFLSTRTVESHRYAIRKKLNLTPEQNLMMIARSIIDELE